MPDIASHKSILCQLDAMSGVKKLHNFIPAITYPTNISEPYIYALSDESNFSTVQCACDIKE